ncbi:MAG: DUF2059 domain-containing protein [Pseudomonadota bacterium]
MPRLIAGVLLCVATSAAGDATTHRAAVEEYLAVTQVGKQMTDFLARIKASHLAEVERWYIPDDKQVQAREYIEKASEIVNRELGWGELREEFIAAYMDVFSEEELRGLLDFYRTPVGQAYLSKRGQLMGVGVEIARRRVQNIMPELDELHRNLSAE